MFCVLTVSRGAGGGDRPEGLAGRTGWSGVGASLEPGAADMTSLAQQMERGTLGLGRQALLAWTSLAPVTPPSVRVRRASRRRWEGGGWAAAPRTGSASRGPRRVLSPGRGLGPALLLLSSHGCPSPMTPVLTLQGHSGYLVKMRIDSWAPTQRVWKMHLNTGSAAWLEGCLAKARLVPSREALTPGGRWTRTKRPCCWVRGAGRGAPQRAERLPQSRGGRTCGRVPGPGAGAGGLRRGTGGRSRYLGRP